jgi:hypothetical protein
MGSKRSEDRANEMGVAMQKKLGEAFHQFRDLATPEEYEAADVEYNALAAAIMKRVKEKGVEPISMDIAIVMLALEVVQSSVRFSN